VTKHASLIGSWSFTIFQWVMAWYFALPQMNNLLVGKVDGVTINWIVCATSFIILNLFLVLRSGVKMRDMPKVQAVSVYLNWVVLMLPMSVLVVIRCNWAKADTVIMGSVLIAAILTVIVGRRFNRDVSDPLIKGIMVGLFRAVPHLFLCYHIVHNGGASGIPAATVFAANVTAFSRIITLSRLLALTGGDHSVKASLRSEWLNEGTWLLVTAVWWLNR
jgi:hypothetical protein